MHPICRKENIAVLSGACMGARDAGRPADASAGRNDRDALCVSGVHSASEGGLQVKEFQSRVRTLEEDRTSKKQQKKKKSSCNAERDVLF